MFEMGAEKGQEETDMRSCVWDTTPPGGVPDQGATMKLCAVIGRYARRREEAEKD